MPCFRLETNLPRSKIPDGFLEETIRLVAKTLGKPESYCVAEVVPDLPMMWGGESGPCGNATLLSIGQLGVQQNKKHAAALFDHIEKKLGIPKDKLYIRFVDEASANMGYNGTTFHEIFGS